MAKSARKAAPSAKHAAEPTFETREVGPESWPAIQELFGANGACGGCWCMSWRHQRGDDWEAMKGAPNKRRLKSLIESGQAHGILAFAGSSPVGWCSFERRTDLPRLDRSPSLSCNDAERVWSLPCFFVRRGYRGQGVAKAMLDHALCALKARGAEIAEGYPVKPPADGKPIPAAFAWTGTRSLFSAAGFRVAGNRDGGKQRVRRKP